MIRPLLTLFLFLFLSQSFIVVAQKSPKRELRGAWVTTHLNLDWPFSSAHTVTRQRDSLLGILDMHKAMGMNTIYFQVRSQSDALYASAIEPWAAVLTGVQGRNPGWDPLQFAIDECRKRGMEIHAWINLYRAVANTANLPNFAANHVARQHPEWMLTQGVEQILNPGLPQVRDYLVSVVTDIVSRYDVDGIHFDDYFYIAPPATGVQPYNDDATYAADPRGFPATTAGRADWRRDNVNMLIKRVNEIILALKPWVKFGVSPSGIYRSSTNPAIGSATSAGAFQHYSAVYADSKRWLQEGWVDYLAPQLYWFIGQTGSDYRVLVPWWNDQAAGRHIYIGQAIYKVADPAQGANWLNRSQIPNQMRLNRDPLYQNVYGEIGFRTRFFRTNVNSVRDSIRLNIYRKPALVPTMPWKDNTPPQAPSALAAVQQPNGNYLLNWTKPAATTNEIDKVRQFVIYRSLSPVIDINDTANLLFITPTDVNTFTDNTTEVNTTYYYVVTSVDRMANESAPSNVTDYLPPVITCPANQLLTLNTTCSATVPDYRSMAVANDDVSLVNQIIITQTPAAGGVIDGKGNTTVTLTATDASGKSSTCTFTATAEDKIAPQITCSQNMTINPGSLDGAAVSFPIPVGTDNCNGAVTTQTDGPASGSVFPIGSTKVGFKVVDASGNESRCSFTITVRNPFCTEDKKNSKVYICNNGNTLCVSVNAAPAFLKKGARLGMCEWYVDNSITGTRKLSTSPTEEESAPANFGLNIYPNPVADHAQIQYMLPEASHVSIRLFDLAGRQIGQVFAGDKTAGTHKLIYNASGLSNGVYYFRINATCSGKQYNQIQKLIKAK